MAAAQAAAAPAGSNPRPSVTEKTGAFVAERLDNGLLCVHDVVADSLKTVHTHARSFITNHAVPQLKKVLREDGASLAAASDVPASSRLPDLDIKCQVLHAFCRSALWCRLCAA